MRIVVAGASGFIGGHLIDELLRHDVEPIAMVRPGSDAARLRELELEVVEVDVLDLDAVRPIMRRAEFVINAVQLTSPGLSGEAYDDVNVGGTTNLLDAAVEGGVGGFVQLSSTTMYGDALPHWPVNEGWAMRPPGALEQSRAMAERAARTYRRRIPLILVRPALSFGPRDRGLMRRLLLHFLDQRPLRLVGGGRAPVSLAYGPDLARAVWGLVDRSADAIDAIFHVKSFDTDWSTVVSEMHDLLHRSPDVRSVPASVASWSQRAGLWEWIGKPPRDVPQYVTLTGRPHLIDDSRLRSVTGFEPVFGLRAALRQTLESMAEERPDLRI